MVYVGTCDCYDNIKIKLWSTSGILKPSLQKENDCKAQLHFVKCCTLVVTEGYHILLSPLNRLVICHFIMSRMYITGTSWEHNQRSVVSVNGAGWLEPFRRGFRGWSPLRKFLGSKEYLDWFSDTGMSHN